MYYLIFIATICLFALVRAFWQGARPQVALFGADATSALMNHLRRRLGLPLRENRDVHRTDDPAA